MRNSMPGLGQRPNIFLITTVSVLCDIADLPIQIQTWFLHLWVWTLPGALLWPMGWEKNLKGGCAGVYCCCWESTSHHVTRAGQLPREWEITWKETPAYPAFHLTGILATEERPSQTVQPQLGDSEQRKCSLQPTESWDVASVCYFKPLHLGVVCYTAKSNWYSNVYLAMKVTLKVAQSCWALCDPMDYRVHGVLQAKILEWAAFPFSRGSSQPRDWMQVSLMAGRFFTSWTTREDQEYWSG